MAMSARLVRASTTVRPALARKAGAADAAKLAGATQSACDPPSVKSKRSAFLRSSCAGRPLDGSGGAGGKRRVAERRLARGDQPGDRAGLLAVVQQDGRGRARRRGRVDEGVDPGSRRQHQRAIARQERLGRLAVEGHDPDIMTFYFHSNDIALKAIDKAKSQAFMGAGPGYRSDRPPVDGVERHRVLRIDAGRDRGSVGRSRQSSIRNTSSRSTATGSLSPTISASAPRRPRLTVAEQPRSHRKVPAWRSGIAKVSLAPGASGARAASGSAAGTPSIPRQLSTAGTGSSFRKRDFKRVATLEAQSRRSARSAERPYRRIRLLPDASARTSALACSASDGAACAAAIRRTPDQGPQRPIRPAARVGPAGKSDLPWLMRTIFRWICPVAAMAGGGTTAIFLLRTDGPML